MEGFFSEWFEFHKCVLAGDCSIFDMPDAICYIDVVIFMGLTQITTIASV